MPVSIFLQFTKVVNCFYFLQMVMQLIPSIRTINPSFAAVTLAILVIIGMIKELVADCKRLQTDR